MSTKTITFLKKPKEIKHALGAITENSKHLDLAVAFVGAGWPSHLSGFSGHIRLICWLSSTNTNPYSIEELVNRPNTEVRQRDSMHCKVYLSPRRSAIVGSANLTSAALSDLDNSGQNEAAALITDHAVLKDIQSWFNALWHDPLTEHISDLDLRKAKSAWVKARKKPPRKGRAGGTSDQGIDSWHSAENLSPLEGLAQRVREISDLRKDIGEPSRFVHRLSPGAITRPQVIELVGHLASWTGHPGAYERFKNMPIGRIRSGLQLLFDESVPLSDRLSQILSNNRLEGLRVPTLSLLLYWRTPESYPPYNHRTIIFLKDNNRLRSGVSASSSHCYKKWTTYASEIAEDLDLPTPGHVDRMVHYYYEDRSEGKTAKS